jgi:hypothetical protein
MPALRKIARKRTTHPNGDTMYRAATVAAALMLLATAAFL